MCFGASFPFQSPGPCCWDARDAAATNTLDLRCGIRGPSAWCSPDVVLQGLSKELHICLIFSSYSEFPKCCFTNIDWGVIYCLLVVAYIEPLYHKGLVDGELLRCSSFSQLWREHLMLCERHTEFLVSELQIVKDWKPLHKPLISMPFLKWKMFLLSEWVTVAFVCKLVYILFLFLS